MKQLPDAATPPASLEEGGESRRPELNRRPADYEGARPLGEGDAPEQARGGSGDLTPSAHALATVPRRGTEQLGGGDLSTLAAFARASGRGALAEWLPTAYRTGFTPTPEQLQRAGKCEGMGDMCRYMAGETDSRCIRCDGSVVARGHKFVSPEHSRQPPLRAAPSEGRVIGPLKVKAKRPKPNHLCRCGKLVRLRRGNLPRHNRPNKTLCPWWQS